ncbi:thioesterase domain-containing protein [Pleionea sp. CnH1-48]|uniref:thioesterase II family protein n=1 Tax=Pleionea sp. CnH1-48 TaxID=2954494 RepID=UPI0020982D88|nr:thioesterase domain-containing protein [Pleionea sp. CnH1-48]
MTAITLFAVPYAGGSADAIYTKWKKELGEEIQLIPLEYAGHGVRMSEKRHDRIEETVADMLLQISPVAREEPYAIYGHSMGCVVVYELLKAIAELGLPAPKEVFLSGRNPPHREYKTSLHTLPEDEFLDEIKQIGGTPQDFFEIKELRNMFLPILRNDYKLVEEYKFQSPQHLTHANLSFFYSDKDSMVELSSAYEWQDYTYGHFTLHRYRGGHFFIHDFYSDMCQKIRNKLVVECQLV